MTIRLPSACGLVGCFVLSAIACSSSEEPDLSVAPPDAGGAVDAGSEAASPATDASPDDAAEARPSVCSEDGFCHTELPPKSLLRDVWSAGDGTVWAVGWSDPQLVDAKGKILRWDGDAWSVAFESELRLNAVWGSSATDLWVGGDGGLFHGTGTSASAITWTKVRSEPIASIWGTSATDVWAVGSTKTWITLFDGKVLHYTGPAADGGDGWQIDPLSSRPAAYRKVWGTSADDVWVGGSEFSTCGYSHCNGSRGFAVRRRPDGHGSFVWSEDGMPDFVGIMPNTGIHQGSELTGGGAIDGGAAVWMMGNQSPKKQDNSFDVLFIGTRKTDGSGDYTWSEGTFGTCRGNYYPPCPRGLWFSRAVWGQAANDVYLAGDFGQFRHWDGKDFSFPKTTIQKVPIRAHFYAMWGSSNDDLWLVGDEIALHERGPNNNSTVKANVP